MSSDRSRWHARRAVVVAMGTAGVSFVAGCAALLGADFDRPADPVEGGAERRDVTQSDVASCEVGRADCNGDPTDGCESEIDNDPKNCGACGRACSAGLVCGKATCLKVCPEGTRSCSGACKPESVTSCGAACVTCTAPAYGAGTCTAGGCDFTCRDGYSRVGTGCVDSMPSDTWTQAANLPTARSAHAVVTAGGLVYAVGGSNSEPVSAFEAYDPRTDSWTKLPDMPTPRLGLAAAVGADGRIYAIGGGGFDVTTRQSTVEVYDPPTKTWTTVANMPTARMYLAAATGQDGRIYAIGGSVGPLVSSILSTVEVYTPSTNTWASAADMPTKRSQFGVAAASDGRIYAIGSQTFPSGGPSVDVYTPSSDSWTTVANMPTARLGLAVASVNDLVVAFGGLTATNADSYTAVTESYSTGTKTWTSRKAMPTARSFFGATSVDGRVYAIGGQRKTTDPRLSTVEVYKP